MEAITPETRSAVMHLAVTPTEKRAVELVAAAEGRSISELLRTERFDLLVKRGHKLASLLRDLEPAA